jgi:hypothetical protein
MANGWILVDYSQTEIDGWDSMKQWGWWWK